MNTLANGATPLYMQLYTFVAAIMLVTMVVFGKKQWRRIRYTVVRQFDNKPLIVASGAMATVFTIIYMIAEASNVIQWYESGASIQHADAGITVSIGILISVAAVFAVSWLILFITGIIASYAENGRLHIDLDKRMNAGLYQEYDPREVRARQARQARQYRRDVDLSNRKYRR